jgi:hypothetical protein
MALDEGPLRMRVRQAIIACLLALDDSELPRGLRPTFRRLGSVIAPAHLGRGLTADLGPLSDDDVRYAARLIVELNGHLNTTWRSPADQESGRAWHDRR